MYTLSVENAGGERMELTNNRRYTVTSVEGLNPPKANVSLTKLAGMHGSRKNIATIPSRNIVIYIKVENPAEENRLNLYKYFRAADTCRIYFKNGIRNVYISGTVENIECPLFELNQIMQVSIICEQPYFRDAAYFIAEISKIQSMFEFPFSIDGEGREFSAYDQYRVTELYNTGDVDTGITIRITATGNVVNPKIWNSSTREYFGVAASMAVGDVIEIHTVQGERHLWRGTESSVEYENIINRKMDGSTWLMLKPGENAFTYTCDSGDDNASVVFSGNNLYGGV